MSTSNMSSAFKTLYQLVAYLTRPLIELYPAQNVLQLQFFLHANLASQFLTPETTILSLFTLLLTPASLPPTPIYAACLQSGIAWPQWLRALGGKALYIFVMDGNLKVRVGEIGDAVTIWSAEPTEVSAMKVQTQPSSDEHESPMTLKLKAILDSVRTRSSPAQKTRKPALFASSCLSHTDAADDSDSESDTESNTASSIFSETSSVESMSSVSSATSSPILKVSNLPSLGVANTASSQVPVYVPRHRRTIASPALAQIADPVPHQHLSRSQRRLARATVDKAKVDTCRYTYQGGQTLVMTGGVMLGGVKSAVTTTAMKATQPHSNTTKTRYAIAATKTQPHARKGLVVLGSNSSKNWRARV